jgi:hypothetical protein
MVRLQKWHSDRPPRRAAQREWNHWKRDGYYEQATSSIPRGTLREQRGWTAPSTAMKSSRAMNTTNRRQHSPGNAPEQRRWRRPPSNANGITGNRMNATNQPPPNIPRGIRAPTLDAQEISRPSNGYDEPPAASIPRGMLPKHRQRTATLNAAWCRNALPGGRSHTRPLRNSAPSPCMQRWVPRHLSAPTGIPGRACAFEVG